MKNEKDDALLEATKNLNKKYGARTVMSLGDVDDLVVEAIPTGSFSLDSVFGCGGLPRGRVVEIYGQEASGKSSLALYIAAQVQKTGGSVVWIDAESSWDTKYSSQMGIQMDKIIVSQPEYGELAFEIIDEYARSNAVDLIVVDSVAALVSKDELEKGMDEVKMAGTARMMSSCLRRVTGTLSKSKTSVIFINQLRNKIGVFWGSPTTTVGGSALKYYSSVRLDVKKSDKIEKDKITIGNVMKVYAAKNKVGVPFRSAELTIIYGKGIDVEGETFDVGVKSGVIVKTGNTYTYGETKLGVGAEAVKEKIISDKKLMEEIRSAISKTDYVFKPEKYGDDTKTTEENS